MVVLGLLLCHFGVSTGWPKISSIVLKTFDGSLKFTQVRPKMGVIFSIKTLDKWGVAAFVQAQQTFSYKCTVSSEGQKNYSFIDEVSSGEQPVFWFESAPARLKKKQKQYVITFQFWNAQHETSIETFRYRIGEGLAPTILDDDKMDENVHESQPLSNLSAAAWIGIAVSGIVLIAVLIAIVIVVRKRMAKGAQSSAGLSTKIP
jgi:hypothetical protein